MIPIIEASNEKAGGHVVAILKITKLGSDAVNGTSSADVSRVCERAASTHLSSSQSYSIGQRSIPQTSCWTPRLVRLSVSRIGDGGGNSPLSHVARALRIPRISAERASPAPFSSCSHGTNSQDTVLGRQYMHVHCCNIEWAARVNCP